jgi:L,D-transpeptidase catalytic domain/Putative peptidoglycan binding domain
VGRHGGHGLSSRSLVSGLAVVVLAGSVTAGVAFGVRDTGRGAAQAVTQSPVATPSATSSSPTSTPTPTASASASPTLTPAAARPKPNPLAFHKTIRKGWKGPIVGLVQQRLVWTGLPLKRTGVFDSATVSAVKKFQVKQLLSANGRVDQTTFTRLAQVTKRKAKLDPRCSGAVRVLCIDKSQKVLRYLVHGKVVMLLDVRFGSVELPTREGVFDVYAKSRYHVSTLYHTPMPYALFFSGGQAVHYSMFFHAVGYAGTSHGCVNVRDQSSMSQLFDEVPIGTKVVIYRQPRSTPR